MNSLIVFSWFHIYSKYDFYIAQNLEHFIIFFSAKLANSNLDSIQ